MHFAFISSFHKETTLHTQGGAQVWAAQFLLEEIKRNNTFDLFAVVNSIDIPGKINLKVALDPGVGDLPLNPFFANSKTLQRDLDAYSFKAAHKILLDLKENEDKYDMVIDSSGRPLIGINWEEFKKPMLVIGHSPVERQYVNLYNYFKLPKNIFFVFPTEIQSRSCKWIPEESKFIIPHGTDISELDFTEYIGENNLVFLGRFDPDTPKGLEQALEVANKTDFPLDVYTYVENEFKETYDSKIVPKFQHNPKIKLFLPPQPPKKERFQKAKALLFPTMWEEPFGLVMIEAMATGTPIIGFARGSVPEIIKDGETGFIVNPSNDDIRGNWITQKTGIEGLCEAVNRIFNMPEEEYKQMRINTRKRVEENYTIVKMIDNYNDVIGKILNQT